MLKNENNQNRKYSTNTVAATSTITWTDWYNNSYTYIYPFFTSDYYYIGQIVVVAGIAVTCYYVIPLAVNEMYKHKHETIVNSTKVQEYNNIDTIINNVDKLHEQITDEILILLYKNPIKLQERIANIYKEHGELLHLVLKKYKNSAPEQTLEKARTIVRDLADYTDKNSLDTEALETMIKLNNSILPTAEKVLNTLLEAAPQLVEAVEEIAKS